MDDTKGKGIPVKNARGEVTGYRGSGVGAGVVEAEDEVDRYKRTKGTSREAWPGEHDSNIKKLQGEENERRKKAGLPEKYPSPTPSPAAATPTPDLPKKK